MGKEAKWDAATDRKLLLKILELSNVKPDCGELAKAMSTDSCQITAKAVSVRISRLKAMAKEDAGGNDASTPAPKTPRKCSAPGSTKATPSKKTANGTKTFMETHGQDEDDEEVVADIKGGSADAEGDVKDEASWEDSFT